MKSSKFKILISVIFNIKNWPLYLLDYLRIKKGKFSTYNFRNGSKIKIRSNDIHDRCIVNEVWIHRFYTPMGFEIKKEDIVLDIGAHIGIFSIFASCFAKKVFSFEPVTENFELLKENIILNEAKNVIAIREAVSGKTGKTEIFLDKTNYGGNSIYAGTARDEKREVQTVSLMDFLKENDVEKIDFMKIDCEGSEYDILFECPDGILSRVRKISMEYHNIDQDRNVSTLKDYLVEKGFNISKASGGDFLYASK